MKPASMEPLPEERNHGTGEHQAVMWDMASMEPLPEERNHQRWRRANNDRATRLNGAAP